MKDINMVDLRTQYFNIKEEVDSAIQDVIKNTAFIRGPQVKTFQDNLAKYLDTKHVIGCGNGTDALQVAMMALGLQAGDEVITSNFTFVATVEVIALLGLKPVLVDVHPDTFTLDPEKVIQAITPKTKAIVPVHLFGQCADMEELMKIANEHNLFVIEDNAQAIGADYTFSDGTVKKAGTIGDFGTASFFPSKNLGCFGDGGAIITNNSDLAKKVSSIVNHGMEVRYYHDRVGVNSRLDTLQAAILDVKLKYLDNYNKARQKAAAFYDAKFANHPQLQIPVRSKSSNHIFHQYTLISKDLDRNALQEFLKEKGIPMMIYYPVPLHEQKAYADDNKGSFPVTEHLCKNVFSLPMHTELEEAQLEHIANSVLEFLDK